LIQQSPWHFLRSLLSWILIVPESDELVCGEDGRLRSIPGTRPEPPTGRGINVPESQRKKMRLFAVGASFAITRLKFNLLFGVSATDPLTFVGVAVLLLSSHYWLPTFPRACTLRINPVAGLIYE
jgi:hypothetical protein